MNYQGHLKGTKTHRRRTSKEISIDCDKCQAYGCYSHDQDDVSGRMMKWIEAASECKQADTPVDGANVYYRAMCNQDGDGVQLAVFRDENCSLYMPKVNFNEIYKKEQEVVEVR